MKDNVLLKDIQRKIGIMMNHQVDHELLRLVLEDCLISNLYMDLKKKEISFLLKNYPAIQYKYQGNFEEDILKKGDKESVLAFYKDVETIPEKAWKKHPRKKILDSTINLKKIDTKFLDSDDVKATAMLIKASDFHFTMMLKKHPVKDHIMVNILLPNTIRVQNVNDYIDKAIEFLQDLKNKTRVSKKG